MQAISSYCGNRPPLPARPSAKDRGDYNTLHRRLACSVLTGSAANDNHYLTFSQLVNNFIVIFNQISKFHICKN